MKIRSKVLGSSIGTAIAATGFVGLAQADEYAAPRAAYVAPPTWSGFYAGASVGGAWSTLRDEWPVTDVFFCGVTGPCLAPATGRLDLDSSGLTAGIHAGVQHQWGALVAGVELSASTYHNMRESESFVTGPPCTIAPCGIQNTINWSAQAVGRLGIAAGPVMPYVKGGIAVIDINSLEVIGVPPNIFSNALAASRDDKLHSGWVLGGGLDWMVTKGVVLGVDYQHIFVNDASHTAVCVLTGPGSMPPTFPAGAPCPVVPNVGNVKINGDIDAVTARLTFLFGREPPAPLK